MGAMRESYLLSKHGDKNVLERRESMKSKSKQQFSKYILLKRALAYLLVTAMVISGFNMIPAAKLTAEAAPSGNLDGATLVTTFETGKYTISNGSKTDSVTVTKEGNYYKVSIEQVDYYLARTNNCGESQYHLINDDAGVLYTNAYNKYITFKVNDTWWHAGLYDKPYYKWNFTRKADFEAGNYKVTNSVYQTFTYNGTISVEGTDNYITLKGIDDEHYKFRVNYTESGCLIKDVYSGLYASIEDGYGFWLADNHDIEEGRVCQYWDIKPIPNTTVTFDKNAEDATGEMESKTFENGKVVNANAVTNGFSRTGYSFDGYYTEAGTKVFDSNGNPCKATDYIEVDSGEETNIYTWICTASELTLYAHWKRIYTDVTFSGNAKDNDEKDSAFFLAEEGGSSADKTTSVTRTFNVGDGFDNYAMPIPSRDGFKFEGYYTDATNGKMVFDAEGKPYIEAGQESVQKSDYFAVSEDEKVTWKYLKEGDEDADKKLTLYAHWSRAYTNVTFDKNATKAKFDGEVEPIKFEAGKAVPKIPVAKYDGFEFTGYYTAQTDGTKVVDKDAQPVTASGYFKVAEAPAEDAPADAPKEGTILWTDVTTNKNEAETFYAQWNRVQTKITFNDIATDVKGGNELKTYKVGDEVVKVNVPSRSGFEFGGYYTEQEGKGKQLFDDAGQPVCKTDDGYIDNAGKWLDNTTARNNRTDTATEELTIYANWIPRKPYTISYYDREWLNSGSGIYEITYVRTGDKQINVQQGNFMTYTASEAGIDVSEHPEYTFEGWSTKQNASEAEYMAGKQFKGSLSTSGEEVKLYAVWSLKNGYRISYNSNVVALVEANGIPTDDEITEKNADGKYIYVLPNKPIPERKNYTFKGWAKKATATAAEILKPGATVEITADTTFYAQWELNPTVSYIANGGTFAEGKEIQTAYYQAGSTVIVVNPRKKDAENPAILTRTGYTFVGWVNSADQEIYSDSTSGNLTNVTFEMPNKAVVLKAKWAKNKYSENVVADSDAYTVSYTGTYSDEEDGTTKDIENTPVELVKAETEEGQVTDEYVGNIAGIPHEADIVLSIKVDSTYNADNIVVKVDGTEYKPVTKTVEVIDAEADTDPDQGDEGGKGATTLTYKVSGITSDSEITINGAVKKVFTVKYVCAPGTVPAEPEPVRSYEAGETEASKMTLPTPVPAEPDKYDFVGWYETADDAKEMAPDKKVTVIPASARGHKTYYAAWAGKKYTVTFDKSNGTSGGSDAQTAIQELTFGVEENLKAFAELFPETVGPNGEAFLGWATSSDDALAHKVAYTDGQKVLDIIQTETQEEGTGEDSAFTLYAVWDITKVNVFFDANGGSFSDGSDFDTKTLNYGDKLISAIQERNVDGEPGRTGFEFKGWATKAEAKESQIIENSSDIAQYEDVTLYAVWKGQARTITYYKDNAGTEEDGHFDVSNGDTLTVGKIKTLDGVRDAEYTTQDGMTLIGWASTKGSERVMYQTGDEIVVSSGIADFVPVFSGTKTHILTYNANGGTFAGTPSIQQLIRVDETNEYKTKIIGKGSIPTKKGYAFVGWSEDKDIEVDATEGIYQPSAEYTYTEPSSDVKYTHTLYAIWKPVTYKVEFNAGKAPVAADDIINKEAADKTQPVLKNPVDEGVIVIDSEESADGQSTEPSGEEGTEPAETTTPAKPYYQTFTYGKEGQFAAPQYDYPGYTFKGWSDTENGKVVYKNLQSVMNLVDEMDIDTEGNPKEKEIKVYAVWAMDTPLTVTYRANGGDLKTVTDEATEEGQTPEPVAVKAPADQKYARIADKLDITTAKDEFYVRDGYKFVGWSTDPTPFKADEAPFADQTSDEVTDPEEENTSGQGTDGTVTPGEDAQDETPVETRILVKAGESYTQKDVFKTTNVTLYAVWQKLPEYKVVYDSNDGDGNVPVDTNSYHFDEADTENTHSTATLDPSIVPTRIGYKFNGWAFGKTDAEGKVVIPETPDFIYAEETTEEKEIEGQTETVTVPARFIDAEGNEVKTFVIPKADEKAEAAKNTVTLYAIWEANKYTVNFYQGTKSDDNKIGSAEFAYDDAEGKLPAVETLLYKAEAEEGATPVENKYTASVGMHFAGWSFKDGGTVSFADEAPVKNLVTGADSNTDTFDLYVVEKENIYTVTLNDDFKTIGENFSENFVKDEWGIVDVNIKERAADDKIVKPAVPSVEPVPGEDDSTVVDDQTPGGTDGDDQDGDDPVVVETDPLETDGIDNKNHKFVVKYNKSLNDIDVPVAPGFVFKGYYATVADTSEGAEEGVMYYDASGNAVKTADFTEDITLTAKWEATKFDVVFQEDGKQIDKMTQEYGQPFKMPSSVKGLSYQSDYEVVGWTPSVDKQHPATAEIESMQAPDKFDVRSEYDADIIAKLYNNYGAEVVLYPIYKTTVKYDIKFSSGVAKGATNLPGTQKVAEADTFTLKFDDVDLRTPYCSGYTFIGWTDSEEDVSPDYIYEKGKTYDIENVSKDITLYAMWVQEITATNKTVTLKDEATGNTYALNGLLFNIPKGYGEATYSLPEGVDGAAIDENGNIIVSKVGTYEVKVTTAATEAVPSAEAKATLTVNAAPEDLTLAETIEQTKLRLKDHADAKNPGDFTNVEDEAYTAAINSGYSIIAGAESVDEIETKLSEAKKKVDEALDKILADRAADAAIIDAQTAATEAETEAATVKKEAANYKLNDDVTAIETAMGNVATAKAAIGNLPANATTADKNAAAEALQNAVDALEQAIDNAKIKVAAAAAEQQAGDAAAAALATAKANAKDRLEDVYDAKNQSDYREAQQAELTNAKNAGIAAINAATTPEAVAEALAAAKNALNSVKTDSTLTKEEAAVADEAAAVEAINDAKTAATAAETVATTAKAAAAKYDLNDDVTAIETARGNVATAKAAIEKLPANATTADKNAAAEALQNAVDALENAIDKANADVAAIEDAADAAINDAQTAATEAETEAATVKEEAENYNLNDDVTAIETAKGNVATAKAAIGNLPANATTADKNAAAEALQNAVDALEQAIDNAKIKVAAAAAEQQAGDAAAAALATAKANAKDRLEDVYDAKNQSDYREAQQAELTDAKNAGIEAIDAATTPDEVSAALATAKNALNSVKTDSTLTKEEEAAAAEEAAKKAAEEAAAKKAAEEAAAKKAAEEAAAKKAAEEAAAKKAAEEAAAKKAAEEAAAKKTAEEAAAKKAADQAAANAVITKINAIGSPVTADSKSAIDAARSAYDALTADQKQYVSQEIVTILTNAEATYKSVTTPKPTYFGEWVNGVWYNADGSQTYGPKGGWKSNSTGWWYEDEVGWYPANCWQKIDGQWYYFDSSGYRAENEWRGGYWLGADGAWTYQPTGSWHLDGYGWWYEDTTGWYPTNCWLKIDGYWYYFGGDGYMLTNQYIDGYWVGADGACW